MMTTMTMIMVVMMTMIMMTTMTMIMVVTNLNIMCRHSALSPLRGSRRFHWKCVGLRVVVMIIRIRMFDVVMIIRIICLVAVIIRIIWLVVVMIIIVMLVMIRMVVIAVVVPTMHMMKTRRV